ncbi:MAG: putative glycoside hydrolase [Elusimicrobia bacterium]|nr:putative glycoside hydrolase [Elusimicrobiota bacterium]
MRRAIFPFLAACAVFGAARAQDPAPAASTSTASVAVSTAAAAPVEHATAAATAPSLVRESTTSTAAVSIVFPPGYRQLRGVHLSAWAAGNTGMRRRFLAHVQGTFLNAIIVPLKEIDGRVYVPGVAKAKEYGTQQLAIPDPEGMLADFRKQNLYTIARIAVFKDDTLPRKMPQWAVHRPDGSVWTNDKGVSWVDPYRKEIWRYTLDVAERAAALGFDEIQFDYIRFPSDGPTAQCRYSRADHDSRTAVRNLKDFLTYARETLKPTGVKVSAALFGMTTTAKDDMGIGQDLRSMSAPLDYVSPMMYPSHYGRGEYGLKNPNREPYKIIHRGLRDAKARLKNDSYKLRPYLQDFSLGYHYGPAQVRAEIMAAQYEGINSWLLWNPSNVYNWSALKLSPSSPIQYPAP